MKTLLLCLWITIHIATSQTSDTISCGETITGDKGRAETLSFIFTSAGSYDTVTFDGCNTAFNLVLVLRDSEGTEIIRERDDVSCPSSTGEQITIPNPVHNGDVYEFYVPRMRERGDYVFRLNCTAAQPTYTPTTDTPTTDSPTTDSPTTRSPTTGSPTTPQPTTDTPTTDTPTTDSPTSVPTTSSPTTTQPTSTPTSPTDAPTTSSPTTALPTTDSPTTGSPTTHKPTLDDGTLSIECGQKLSGSREAGEEVEITYIATDDYHLVYLEGCESTHDIWLEIRDAVGDTIADKDDENQHNTDMQCGHNLAGDITIPHAVNSGDTFTFVVRGYETSAGDYTVELFCENITPSPTTPLGECARHREPWHLLSQEERDLYINGYKRLASQGKLRRFTRTHEQSAVHWNNGFLGWHRAILYELETAIRSLGGEYECFALPYWDWTYEVQEFQGDIAEYVILNSGLGGPAYGECVGGNWSPREYVPLSGDCLMRDICQVGDDDSCYFAPASDLISRITSNAEYDDYTDSLEFPPHGYSHIQIGGTLGDFYYSPDDPIFYLLHCMVDFQWALWLDCRDYEYTDKTEVTATMYNGDDVMDLDDIIPLTPLSNLNWAWTHNNAKTYRDMYDNAELGVTYDKGDFFERANVESDTACGNRINGNYFRDITRRRRRLAEKPLSAYAEFSQETFKRLNKKVGGNKNKSLEQNKLVYKTWAQMDCEYLSLESKCTRPKYFDDCSDMEKTRRVGKNQYDIDITLDELIEKVADYPCMVRTRRKFYDWCYKRGELLALCQGGYDPFCDRDFEDDKSGDKCLAKLKAKAGKSEGFKIFDDGLLDVGTSKNKLTEIEHILLSAVANGIIMTMVIATFICCYWIINNHKNEASNPKFKYDVVDEDY